MLRLNNHISLKFKLCDRYSSSFIIFVGLPLTHSSMSMSFLYWRTQNWTQHSRSGLTSAGQRKIITFLHQLATLYLMQPRMLLNFLLQKLLVDLVPIRTTRSTIAKPLSSWSAPGLYQCLGYFSQGVRLEFSSVELHETPAGQWQPLKLHLNGSTTILGINYSFQFCIFCILASSHHPGH